MIICAGRVRAGLGGAGYTVDGVAQRLGTSALAALQRSETVPAWRATGGGDPLDTLIRLFLLHRPVPFDAARAALPLDEARELGLVESSADEVRAALDVRPYGEAGYAGAPDGENLWWLVSDLGTGLDGVHRPLPAEHVLGVGGASTTLAGWTVRDPVGRTLDLGTGCGVQALHATRHSGYVLGTDVSARALRLAALTAALSGTTVDLRQGDLLEPVAGETFDLVVSNPPFVIGAPAADAHTYRDAGRPLDEVGAHLARNAPTHLNPGGTFQMLANWVHRAGQSWEERVEGWLPDGVTALVVQREVLDPAEYVGTWLRDAGEIGGPSYTALYDAWLRGLEEHGVVAIGFGHVAVRRTDAARRVTTLDWPYAVEQPLGPHVAAWFTRQDFLARTAADLQRAHLRLAEDVVQEQTGPPGAEHPEHVVLRQQVGLRRATVVDTATAALAGACDGTLPVEVLVAAVREVLEPDQEVDEHALLERVRSLLEAGVLHPVG